MSAWVSQAYCIRTRQDCLPSIRGGSDCLSGEHVEMRNWQRPGGRQLAVRTGTAWHSLLRQEGEDSPAHPSANRPVNASCCGAHQGDGLDGGQEGAHEGGGSLLHGQALLALIAVGVPPGAQALLLQRLRSACRNTAEDCSFLSRARQLQNSFRPRFIRARSSRCSCCSACSAAVG